MPSSNLFDSIGALIKSASESEADITTNTGFNTNDIVDSNDEEDFDPVVDDDNLIDIDMD